MEQRQDLARATPDVFMRSRNGPAFRRPALSRMRHRLERTRLVLAPDLQAQGGAESVGLFDQPLFTAASGSVTIAVPCLRLRATTPVSHQVRFFCQLRPDAWRVRPIVYVLMPGNPSSARRRASRNVFSDQVAVPSTARSGGRATSVRIRRCSIAP